MAGTRWTVKEESILIDNYNKMTIPELALKLNKSETSIYNKAANMQLKKRRYKKGAIKVKHSLQYDDPNEPNLEIEGRMSMQDYKVDVQLGKEVRISASSCTDKRLSRKRTIQGKVIYKNGKYIVVDVGNYKESFLISDFYTGQAVLL